MRVRSVTWLLAATLAGSSAVTASAQSFPWREYEDRPEAWFRGEEGRRTTENVLSHQSEHGSWPKNTNTAAGPHRGDREAIAGTFDNGASFGELRYLARAYRATEDDRARDAFFKGLDLTLNAQYPNGGFPQRYPTSRTGYDRHVTFNDGTMVNILEFLRDVAESEAFAFVDADRRSAAAGAFARGIDCIVACQIEVDGEKTVWCAQHDEETLEPSGARAYELVSLSGSESAGILRLLMGLERPGPEVARAIEAGARWFDGAKLTGIRVDRLDGDRVVVPDLEAPPIWARFYEIETNRPFFCGRDGVKKDDLAEIERERRLGYAWYGNWGEDVARRFAGWSEEHADRDPGPAGR